jgi:hypothetical protein
MRRVIFAVVIVLIVVGSILVLLLSDKSDSGPPTAAPSPAVPIRGPRDGARPHLDRLNTERLNLPNQP